jgi:hypothetical protein
LTAKAPRTVDQSMPVATVDGGPAAVPVKGPAGHGAVQAQAEQVAWQGADPGLGHLGAAGQGLKAMRPWCSWRPMRSVSLPIQRPWAVATRVNTPTPRHAPGSRTGAGR